MSMGSMATLWVAIVLLFDDIKQHRVRAITVCMRECMPVRLSCMSHIVFIHPTSTDIQKMGSSSMPTYDIDKNSQNFLHLPKFCVLFFFGNGKQIMTQHVHSRV